MLSHIAFLIPGLTGGGAERVVMTLAAHSLELGRKVDLVVLDDEGELRELVPSGIALVNLGHARVRWSVGAIRNYVKNAKPDILLVSLWPMTVAAVIACIGLRRRPKIILCDHNDLAAQYGRGPLSRFALWLSIQLTYRRADALIGVSQGVADGMARLAGLAPELVRAIPNPVPALSQPPSDAKAFDALWGNAPHPRFLSVGKFKAQKNHALLIEAFARVHREIGGTLAIVGNGPQLETTRAKAAAMGLEGAVRFPGFTLNPAPWYASADVFVVSSDHEGLGNVLIEAMQFGLPVVSTDCPSGPAEIIGDNEWGQLVPVGDAAKLAQAMSRALLRTTNPEAQKKRAAEFAPEIALRAYEAVFQHITKRSKVTVID